MERSEILELMTSLQLFGMKAAYDDIVTAGVKRQHGVGSVIGALLKAEIAAKQARGAVEDAQSAMATTRCARPGCRSPRSWPTWRSTAHRSTPASSGS